MNKKILKPSMESSKSGQRRSLTISQLGNSPIGSIQLIPPSKILPLSQEKIQMLPLNSENKIVENGGGGGNVSCGVGGGDQQSDKSDDDPITIAGSNFVTFIRDFRLKRRALAFISDLAFKKAKKLTKKHFVMMQDPSAKFKVYNQQRQMYSATLNTAVQLPSSKREIQDHRDVGQLGSQCTLFFTSLARGAQNFAKAIKSKALKFLHKIPLFDYQSDKKLFWDLLYCICSLLFLYSIPVHVAFDMKVTQIISLPLLTFSWITIFIHILISLNTCYYEKGLLVNSRPKILHNYLQKTFFVDISSFLPLSIIMAREVDNIAVGGDNPLQILLSLLFVFAIFQFQKVVINIEERFHLSNRLTYFIQLCKYYIYYFYILSYIRIDKQVKLLFNLLFITHIFCCFWLYLGRIDTNTINKSWIITRNIQDDVWQVQYLNGFYFVTVTMISVGYGDIIPQTNSEIILCIIIMLISCGVFAYSVNMIGDILKNIYMQDNLVKQQVRIIDSFMAKNNINQHLRQQIRIYLEYYQRQFSEQNEKEEQKIISHLSENLKNSLMIEANKFILRESPIFSKYFSEGVIEKMVSIIKEYRCTPEQVIYQRNLEKDDPKIFFIKSGIIEIFAVHAASSKSSALLSMQKTSVKMLKQGESFGEFQFFTGNNNSYSARSLEFSRILYITRREFLEILKQYPQDYEKFCFIKDKISFQRDASCIDLKCYICESSKHLIENCNLIHCKLDKGLVIKRQNFADPVQERELHLRQQKKVFWHDKLEQIRESAWRVQDDNESYIENASWMSWDSENYIPSDQEKQCQDESPISISQKNQNKKEFENFINERIESESFREPRKAVQLRQGIATAPNKESSPNNRPYQSITTPPNLHRHIHYQKQMQHTDLSPINAGEANSDGSPLLKFERTETNKSWKKRSEKSFGKMLSNSPSLHPSETMFTEGFHSQKKYAKQKTKSEKKEDKSNFSLYSLKSLGSEAENDFGKTSKRQSMKQHILIPLGGGGGVTPRNNGGSNQGQNGKQMQNPQIFRKLTQGLQQAQQQLAGGNIAQLNIAELIGNQLLMNNKNTYMEKMNEENTFDLKKVYDFYYKHNNYPVVLKQYNKPVLKLIKIIQKNRFKKRINQSFMKDTKQTNLPVVTCNQASQKQSFFKKDMKNSENAKEDSLKIVKSSFKTKTPNTQNQYLNTLLPTSPFQQQLEEDASMISLVLSKNTSRSLLSCKSPKRIPSPNECINQLNHNPLTIEDFNLQNVGLLETLAAQAVGTKSSRNILSENNENQFQDTNYQGEEHLQKQINKLKSKQTIKKKSQIIEKVPSINLKDIPVQEYEGGSQSRNSESPVGGYHPPINTQKSKRQVRELLKHKDSDFTTIEEKTQEYILPNQAVSTSSQQVESQIKYVYSPYIQVSQKKDGQENSKNLTSISKDIGNGEKNKKMSVGSHSKNKKDSLIETLNYIHSQNTPSFNIPIQQNGFKQMEHKHFNSPQQENAKKRDDSVSEHSNQLSDQSIEISSLQNQLSKSSKEYYSKKQNQQQQNHQSIKKLSIEQQLYLAQIEKQQQQQKRKRSEQIQAYCKRESKAFVVDFNNNHRTQSISAMSVRRYSRAYNMSLNKRQSAQQEYGDLNSPQQFDGLGQEKQSRNNIQKFPSSSSSSSDSSNNSSKAVDPFSQAQPKLQIDNFRFDMD